eukprot:TRINITY_DN1196_c0_g1_i6.p1 TRINITY_DN1196_c0_g1~~TRINITY_DN1196_c0_g1_i6.p1  ORF type:complete len:422 (-),score=71.98 TRINITY_DN1196_c0_g1_i6:176-1441(-)
MIICHPLQNPTTSVEWYPNKFLSHTNDYSIQRLLLSPRGATIMADNKLMIVDIKIPLEDSLVDISEYDNWTGGLGATSTQVSIKAIVPHPGGPVSRTSIMPQDPSIIATKSLRSGAVTIFQNDTPPLAEQFQTPLNYTPPNINKSTLSLTGHILPGSGLSWNSKVEGMIVSGSHDHTVCVWDIQTKTVRSDNSDNNNNNSNESITPLLKLNHHHGCVYDVCWHKNHPNIFGSVGENSELFVFDTRDQSLKPRIKHQNNNNNDSENYNINSIDFNPFSEWLIITGDDNKTAKIWDMRLLNEPFHLFQSHQDSVSKVEWSKLNESIFASSSSDGKINIWDLSRINQNQMPEDVDDGPPELLFIHGGHTAPVSGFSWNPNDVWLCASASQNTLQIWQIAENIYNEEDFTSNMVESKDQEKPVLI